MFPVTTGSDGQIIDTYFAHLHIKVYHIGQQKKNLNEISQISKQKKSLSFLWIA